uniref:Uncharacterized protein n=1 Tax=Strigamia maritima TaxID=126957 RepID=T1IKS1_STRMM
MKNHNFEMRIGNDPGPTVPSPPLAINSVCNSFNKSEYMETAEFEFLCNNPLDGQYITLQKIKEKTVAKYPICKTAGVEANAECVIYNTCCRPLQLAEVDVYVFEKH